MFSVKKLTVFALLATVLGVNAQAQTPIIRPNDPDFDLPRGPIDRELADLATRDPAAYTKRLKELEGVVYEYTFASYDATTQNNSPTTTITVLPRTYTTATPRREDGQVCLDFGSTECTLGLVPKENCCPAAFPYCDDLGRCQILKVERKTNTTTTRITVSTNTVFNSTTTVRPPPSSPVFSSSSTSRALNSSTTATDTETESQSATTTSAGEETEAPTTTTGVSTSTQAGMAAPTGVGAFGILGVLGIVAAVVA